MMVVFVQKFLKQKKKDKYRRKHHVEYEYIIEQDDI